MKCVEQLERHPSGDTMFNSVVEGRLDFVTKERGQGGNQTRTWPIFNDIVGVPVRFDRGVFISLAFFLHTFFAALLLYCFFSFSPFRGSNFSH